MIHYSLKLNPDLDPQIALLIATMQDGTREWQEELTDCPDEFVSWRLYPGGHCAGGLIMHMASCERGWIDRYLLGQERDNEEDAGAYTLKLDVDNGDWPEPPAKPLSWYLELYARHRARTIQLLVGQDPNQVVAKDPRADHTLAWIVGHLVQHDSYHGGQIVMLQEAWKRMR